MMKMIISYIMRSKQKQQRRANRQPIPNDSILNRKIVSPQKLKILVLAGNELLNEHLDFLQKCINLIKLDLSHNHLTKLASKIGFGGLEKLEVLQLHHNKLGGVEAIESIFQCPALLYLTYHHNPMEGYGKIEHTIINNIPSLKLINNRIVYIEERSDHLLFNRPLTFVDADLFENWKSTENSEAYYLKVLNMQLQFIDNVWTFNNPIIFIQRAWKHFLPQRYKVSSKSSISRSIKSKLTSRKGKIGSKANQRREERLHPLRQYFDQWKKFSDGLREVRRTLKRVRENGETKDKTYLIQPLQTYFQLLRNMRVRDPLKQMIKRVRRRIFEKKMAYIFMASLKMKNILFESDHSFYKLSGIARNNRIYYNRNQQHLIDNFLAFIAQKFNKREAIYNCSSMQVNKQFNAIRLTDPESFVNKYNSREKFYSFCSLLWPSMKVVAVNRKKTPSKFKAGFIGIRQLSYIKNRDKVITATQSKKSMEVFRRLEKFAQNEYQQSMWYFQCKDAFVMKQLLRMIYYHNTRALKFDIKVKRSEMLSLLESYEQPFIFYVQTLLRRTCAAVAIQKTWRRFLSNKHQKESIYFKMKKNRAALHIQHFYRENIYRHRIHFTNKLYNDLSLFSTETIIYPLEFYLNISLVYNVNTRGVLFKNLRITRKKIFGLSEQFYRSVFHPHIRSAYFENRMLGMENYEDEIDLYNLIHFNAEVKLINRSDRQYISFTYRSKPEAAMIASIIALLTYQLWGKFYAFPLTREKLDLWPSRIEQYRKIKNIQKVIKPFLDSKDYLVKEIKEAGVFLSRKVDTFEKDLPSCELSVQFYQKRYHNFPLKHVQSLIYRFINVEELLAHPLVPAQGKIQPTKKPLKEFSDVDFNTESRKEIAEAKETRKDVPLSITMIEKSRFPFFDQTDKGLKSNDTAKSQKSQLQQFSKTAFVIEQNKREKVMKFYKEEIIKRQAQKQVKESSLAVLREKARQEKTMNMTLKNMKDLERTECLRSKVNRVKQFKNRANSTKKDEEEFIQQNNFVMEQQLRMIIMRNKMKEAEGRREESFANRKFNTDKQSEVRTIQSRKSSKQRVKVDEQELNNSNFQTNVIGEQGSVINAKKRVKKPRANSIGAYIRDPSFVHGVFPEQYYPIESRSTSFYFPPVV